MLFSKLKGISLLFVLPHVPFLLKYMRSKYALRHLTPLLHFKNWPITNNNWLLSDFTRHHRRGQSDRKFQYFTRECDNLQASREENCYRPGLSKVSAIMVTFSYKVYIVMPPKCICMFVYLCLCVKYFNVNIYILLINNMYILFINNMYGQNLDVWTKPDACRFQLLFWQTTLQVLVLNLAL